MIWIAQGARTRFLQSLFLIGVAAAVSSCRDTPYTHTGDKLEPAWIMDPDAAGDLHGPIYDSSSGEGSFIYGVGLSTEGIEDRRLARDQAEAAARAAIARRLRTVVRERLNQEISSVVEKGKLSDSTSKVSLVERTITSELLSNVRVVEFWISDRRKIYAALAQMNFNKGLRRIREEVNKVQAEKVRDAARQLDEEESEE